MLSTFQPLRMQLLPGGRRPALQSPWHSRDTRHALLLSCGPQQPASSKPPSSAVATAAASARRLGSCSSQQHAARLPGRAPSLLSSNRRRRLAAPPASSTAAATAAAASCSPWSTLAVLCTCAAAAQAAEEHTAWGRLLSAPVLTLLLSLAAAGAGLLPSTSPVYDVVWSHLMPLAVALLLLEQDVSGIRAAGGPVLASFLLGAGEGSEVVLCFGWFFGGAVALHCRIKRPGAGRACSSACQQLVWHLHQSSALEALTQRGVTPRAHHQTPQHAGN